MKNITVFVPDNIDNSVCFTSAEMQASAIKFECLKADEVKLRAQITGFTSEKSVSRDDIYRNYK